MYENVLVSVVMPAYNDEKFISDAISSVLSQTHSNLELIIVEDCSKDNTLKIIQKFKDSRIRLFINRENKGASFSRNLAIKEAVGDYIAFLDGDDLWDKRKLEKQLGYMIINSYGFSYTNYEIINEGGKTNNIYVTGPKIITHKKFMRMNYIGCLTAMYKRIIYPNLEIPDCLKRRNDYALWLKLSEKCDCYLYNQTLAYYRKRSSGSITTSNKNGLFSYHELLFRELYNFGKIRCFLIFCRGIFYSILKKMHFTKKIKCS